jgi:hypothetical protein
MAVRIKGQAFLGFVATLRELRGEDTVQRALARLPADVARAIKSGEITSMGWYPIEWYTGLHAAVRGVAGNRASREIGRAAAKKDINTIYRFILRFLSPETLLNQSAKVFALFCDGGKVTVMAMKKGSARILYSECQGASQGMWDLVLGGTEVIVETCGGKSVAATAMTGGCDGDSSLLAQITWT